MKTNKQSGFTLIEILVVIGLIAILAAVVLIAINPARQFAQGRDSQRVSNLNSILNAIGQRIADNKGKFEGQFTVGSVTYYCNPLLTSVGNINTTARTSVDTTPSGDLGCLVPTYIPEFPKDPTWVSGADTGYNVWQDTIGRVHVQADATEPAITRTAPIDIVR
jgi:prepilin-type N-terminal cleavage/methylation domain-containing protein